MKLPLSLWVFVITGFIAPAAVAEQQVKEMGWGQKARSDPDAPQTNQAQDSAKKAGRVLGVCEVIANEKESYPNSTDSYAASAAMMYLVNYEGRNDITYIDLDSSQTSVTVQPKHGTLKEDTALNGRYFYSPDTGYVGKDSAEVLVEIKGMKVKVHYFIHVTEYSEPDPNSIYCLQGERWKISQDPNGSPILTAVNYQSPFTSNTGSSFTDTAALASTLSPSILTSQRGQARY